MDSIVRHHIHVDVWQPEQPYMMCLFPKPSSSPNSPPKRVLLDFVFQTIHCHIFHPCDENIPSTSILEDPVLPFPGTHEFFDAETLVSSSNTTCQIIMAKLTELLHGGRFVDYEEIVHKVSTFSRKACSDSSNAGKETIRIRVRIRVVHEEIIYETIQLVANAIANADTMCGMVRSSKKSINDLSIKKLTSDDFETHRSCVVCLENFVSGTEVKCMPCLHVFHQDCITKWLENSHYCPICRFQMPTEYEDEEEKEVDDDR